MKGYSSDDSKKFKSLTPKWGTGRSFNAQPPRMPRSVKSGSGGSGNSRPPAGHAKYGVDPSVGPVKASRSVGNAPGGSGNARPRNNTKYVKGVKTKPNPGYGV